MATTSSRHESLLNQTTPRPPTRRPRRLVVGALIVLGSAGVAASGGMLALAHRPGFHATRGSHAPDPGAARRFITKAASLRDAASRSGSWDQAFTEQECNAWLADDLPHKHPGLLPAGVVEPRVRLGPGTVDIAAVLTEVFPLPAWLAGAIRPVGSLRLQVRLAGVGRVECRLASAHLGAIPLPKGRLLHAAADRLRQLGLTCDIPRVDGQSVLVVTLPTGGPGRPSMRVAALAVGDGEVLVAGSTVEPR